MADVTGSLNGQPIELDNAATEATLRQVLSSLKTLNQSVVKMSSSSGGGGGSGSSGAALQAVAVSAGLVSGVFSGLLGALGGAASVVAGFVAGVSGAVSGLMNFAGNLIQGTGSLSGFYGALTSLPGPLGMVAGLFQKIAQLQEQEMDTYRKLTQSGVNFGGSLTDIRQSALSLGMTLEDFGNFVTNNIRALQMMGGSTNSGTEAFVRLGKDMRTSGVGQSLLSLGYSFNEINTGMADYIEMTGGRTAEEMKNTKGLTASAGEYMKQLDMLSQITGQSREELVKQQKEQAKNAAWQSYLQSLDEKGREKANASLNAAMAKGGKGAADALQSSFLGLPPLTDEAKTFVSLAGESADALYGYKDIVNDSTKGMADIDKNTAKLSVGLAARGKELDGQLGGALIAGKGAVGEFAQAAISANNEMKRNNFRNQEDYEKYLSGIRKEQEARESSAAAKAAESANAFKSMGDAVYGMLAPALAAITPIINDIATGFMKFVGSSGALEQVRDGLTTLAIYVSNFAKNLMSKEGREKIINDIKYYFGLLVLEIKDKMLPWFLNWGSSGKKAELERQKKESDSKAGVVPLDAGLKEQLAKNKAKDEEKLAAEGKKPAKPPAAPLSSENTAKPPSPQAAASEAAAKAEAAKPEEKKETAKTPAPAPTPAKTAKPPEPESVVGQLAALNKQTEEMVRVLKDATENIKRNVDATRSLNRNLYPT